MLHVAYVDIKIYADKRWGKSRTFVEKKDKNRKVSFCN